MPFPGRQSDLTVLNTWSDGDVSLTERRGTLASGKQRKARYALDIRSEPLLMDLDELNLGNVVAEAWAQRIRDQIQGIAVPASKATQAIRAKAVDALAKGVPWATKRYRALRGADHTLQPNSSDKLFNDSGALAAGIAVRANKTDGSYTVNLPTHRLNPETFGRGFDAMMDRFMRLVPIISPRVALGDDDIEKAIKQGVADMVSKAESNNEAAIIRGLAKLRAAKLRALKAVIGAARALAT